LVLQPEVLWEGVITMSHLHGWMKESGEWRCNECGVAFEDARMTVARRTDPETSWQAAESASKTLMTKTRQGIYDLLKEFGPMTDEEIWRGLMYRQLDTSTSPSGARTRRSELVDANKVRDTGERKAGTTGRKMILWGAIA